MKRALLVGLSLCGIALIAWNSRAEKSPDPEAEGPRAPHNFGGIHPRISPSGRDIVCSFQGAIWRLPRAGGTMTRLTDGAGFDIEPAWSPDGQRIAYVSGPKMSGGDLKVMRSESGEPVALPAGVQAVDTVAYAKLEFTRDGRLAGNFRVGGKDVGLALLDLSSGETQPVAKPSKVARFALSHDGRWFVHTVSMDVDGQQWGNDGRQAEIWKVPLAGGDPVLVTRFPSKVHDLCFSADDTALFLSSEFGGAHFDLWRVPLDDPERGARRITSGQGDEDRPSVSSDGRWLVYSDNRYQCTSLVVRDLETGADAIIAPGRMEFGKPTGTLRLKTIDKESG
jgi:Tol biopolymer transport system component